VLKARGIAHRLDHGRGVWMISVPAEWAEAATAELLAYEVENEGWVKEIIPDPAPGAGTGALAFALVLVAVFLLEFHGVGGVGSPGSPGGLAWGPAGEVRAQALIDGEWWRALTGLTLHTGIPHLVSNLVFGALFGVLVALAHGPGVGWLVILVAGGSGNVLAASLAVASDDPMKRAVGASTAVFAAIGILVGSEFRRRGNLRQGRFMRIVPVLAGLVFLAELGVGGERTDVVAHVTGFAAGIPFGALLAALPLGSLRHPTTQTICALVALALLTGAWWRALL